MAEDNLEKLTGEEETAHDKEVRRLSDRLDEERDARRQDWFLFILSGVIVLDIFVFPAMTTWGGPVAIAVLELVLLVLVAERFGVDSVSVWVSYVVDKFGGRSGAQ